MLIKMESAGGGGGSIINPTVLESWYTNGAINYTYTIDPSKTYLFIRGYVRETWNQYQNVEMIKNGALEHVYGDQGTTTGTLTLSGTTLSYTRSSVSYAVYSWFIQLD